LKQHQRLPEGFYEDNHGGKPEILWLEIRAEAAEQDRGRPYESQRAKSVPRPLAEGNHPHEAVQPPLPPLRLAAATCCGVRSSRLSTNLDSNLSTGGASWCRSRHCSFPSEKMGAQQLD